MIYVMADLHGNMRRFQSVLKQIDLQPEDTLYILGDVIDRHPDGIEILKAIMQMSNVKMLLGNHEYMMLNCLDPQCPRVFWDNPRSLWYQNGGKVTMRAFRQESEESRKAIIAYLRSLPLSFDLVVNGTSYKLVHGCPVEWAGRTHSYYDYEEEFAVWERIDPATAFEEDYTIVFGHTPTAYYDYQDILSIWYSPKLIGIDCGCGYPDDPDDPVYPIGRLACLRLDDMREFYSEEIMPTNIEVEEGQTEN